jgi:hypothetical protein
MEPAASGSAYRAALPVDPLISSWRPFSAALRSQDFRHTATTPLPTPKSATTLPLATGSQLLRGRPRRPRTKPSGDTPGDNRERQYYRYWRGRRYRFHTGQEIKFAREIVFHRHREPKARWLAKWFSLGALSTDLVWGNSEDTGSQGSQPPAGPETSRG